MSSPQEGSPKAWLTVAGSAAALFASFGWVNCIGVFQAQYEAHQLREYSSSKISWIPSMEFFFMMFPSALTGKLFDNYGPRVPIAMGTLVHTFGLMMASISREYYQFMLSQSVCSGLGCALIFTPAMAAPYTWFRRRKAIASGLTVAGSSIGGVVFPLMVQHLIPRVGFGWTMRICAFLVLAMLIFATWTVSSRMEHRPKPMKIVDYVKPLAELDFCILCAACFFLYWGMFVPFNYISVVAMRHGMSQSLALSLIPILNGASFLGRTVPNYLADRCGAFNVMIVMTLFTTIIVLALWLPAGGNVAFLTFTALFGVGSGATVGLGPVLIAILSPIKEVGLRMGTTLAIGAIGGLTSPPIAGAIAAQEEGDFTDACVFSGVSYFSALVCFLLLRVRRGGWRVTSAV
ncbi:monocarboxylate permease-like protein [Aspergillus steynii IBT 23096]|uniref:Monocarboxylate permease-like protein n=1 Tax=Aspergillus steynii IBT 23096 TaxID=1392250 RepID=A0A2I2GQE0_9EURO|nr:monocarboxylate permease-like protein [Aspergillus steynii IBT 23096]PLB55088.1 monocarboxylate permease-like protein [Aspergillus steynii IBT 23096]